MHTCIPTYIHQTADTYPYIVVKSIALVFDMMNECVTTGMDYSL